MIIKADNVFWLLAASYGIVYVWNLITLAKLRGLMKRVDAIVRRAEGQ